MLKVPTLKLPDSGMYKCKAVNKAGSSETLASLVVKGQELWTQKRMHVALASHVNV